MRKNLRFPALLPALALIGLVITAGCITTSNLAPGISFFGTGNGSTATEVSEGVCIVTITQANPDPIDVLVESDDMGSVFMGKYTDAVFESARIIDGWVWTYAFMINGNPVTDKTNTSEEPLVSHLGTYNDTITIPITRSDNSLLNMICDGKWSVFVSEELV
jgi:hypothetical protein